MRLFVCWMVLVFSAGTQLSAEQLTRAELTTIYLQAADRAAQFSPNNYVIAVVDRDGRTLLVRRARDGKAVAVTDAKFAIAVSKAGTAVYLSSNSHAFSSRTAGFIIQQNFPPRIQNRPPGPLVGVGFSNLAFSDVNYFSQLGGARIPGTRLYASPGGVPIYKNGILVAGIGVTGDGSEQEDASITKSDKDEAVALAGQIGFAPASKLHGSNVFIDGIRVAYVASKAVSAPRVSVLAAPALPTPPKPKVWPKRKLGGVTGELRAPIIADPLRGSPTKSRRTIDGQARLTQAEVTKIITAAAARARQTRAGIRLPAGQAMQCFITVVSNPDKAGEAPRVLGTFRTPDATIFSWDVAVQKARTALFFSNNKRAYSTRSVGFLAQSMYPPGIKGSKPGPFNGLQERYAGPLLTSAAGANKNLPNGITIFPGGIPLYRKGVLIGAIGVSGDGIDQDDLVAAAGAGGFLAPKKIRADSTTYRRARVPYVKFPRDPKLR
jgi:uncharacterized protein GlcG (DUF336 family)